MLEANPVCKFLIFLLNAAITSLLAGVNMAIANNFLYSAINAESASADLVFQGWKALDLMVVDLKVLLSSVSGSRDQFRVSTPKLTGSSPV